MLDAFEYHGLWWIPEAPQHRIAGVLSYTPGRPARLDLIGQLPRPVSPPDERGERSISFGPLGRPRVLGMSTEGKKFTLEGCSAESITLSAPGIPTESFSPQCILEGELYERDSPIQFDELALRYTHLDAWTHVNGFHVALRDEQVKAVDVRYEAPQPIVAAGEDFEFEIGFDWSMTPPSASAASFQLTQHAAIRVRFRKAVVLDELLGYVYQFRNFLGLAVGRPVRTSFVAGIVRVTPDEASDIRARRARPRRIEITYRPNIPPVDSAPSVDPDDMLFTLPEAHSRLSELLANWFAKATILRPVFDLYYFGTIYNRHAFVEQQFLNLMQALETYHRRTDARTDLPEDQHAELVAAIIRSAPP